MREREGGWVCVVERSGCTPREEKERWTKAKWALARAEREGCPPPPPLQFYSTTAKLVARRGYLYYPKIRISSITRVRSSSKQLGSGTSLSLVVVVACRQLTLPCSLDYRSLKPSSNYLKYSLTSYTKSDPSNASWVSYSPCSKVRVVVVARVSATPPRVPPSADQS